MHKAAAKGMKAPTALPDKLFYKIGEVSKIAGVEPYVLRYWESEFPFLKPRKSKSGQRIYVKKDLELVLQIRQLLYQERYTIEGVRKRLGESGAHKKPPVAKPSPPMEARSSGEAIELVKKRLRAILEQLS
jgi:DNA-binding transcriptional MerR regulator